MAPVAKEFERIINTARERKKNEALADKIFSANRRQSLPSKLKAAPGGSLASRVGVSKKVRYVLPKAQSQAQRLKPSVPPSQPQKQQQQQQQTKPPKQRRASVPAGDVNGEWTHDLHAALNGGPGKPLRSRITKPAADGSSNGKKNPRSKHARLNAALDRIDTDESFREQVNVVKPRSPGISIRGLAGPFAVMAQNFAPGTTAADIESAMTPVGGEMISCRIVKTYPMILVEMAFTSREGGERVIETFNNKTADGRIIQVFAKPGGYQPQQNAPSAPHVRAQIVDGKNGFSEEVIAADYHDEPLFYADKIGVTRRGRGFQTGRGQ